LEDRGLSSIDVLVGIPSYNEASGISRVAERVDAALAVGLPGRRCVIANADNCSTDGTAAVFAATPTRAPKRVVTSPPGTLGKGWNVDALFALADDMQARVLVLMDADLEVVPEHWLVQLAGPVLDGAADVVFPAYQTSQGGPLTNLVCHPVVAGLFGADIRQPIGGELALSRDLVRRLRREPLPEPARGYGIDIFLTTELAAARPRMWAADLGAKVHRRRPWTGIGFIARQVVLSLVHQLRRHRAVLGTLPPVVPAPVAGEWATHPPPLPDIDCSALAAMAAEGLGRHLALLGRLPASDGQIIERLSNGIQRGAVVIGPDDWPAVLAGLLALGASGPAPECADAVTAVFHGRMASYADEVERLRQVGFDAFLAEQAEAVVTCWRACSAVPVELGR
jgi:hypothetical protein